ncbi:MAG: SCO family protein [Acidimicrobiia bacterium]
MTVIIVAAMAFAIFEPIQVLPRLRLAPGFALTDQNGEFFNSESARGSVTLYSFAPTSCDAECQKLNDTMLDVQTRIRTEVDLGSAQFSMVTIALDPTGPPQLADAAALAGADGDEWRWVGSDDEADIRRTVGTGFQRYFETVGSDQINYDPSFVLVDGNGVVRGDYRYSTIADDGEKLSRHIAILAEEIRNANGATALAYEAAHLFLCYP